MTNIIIRDITRADESEWRRLWREYNDHFNFGETKSSVNLNFDTVTDYVWGLLTYPSTMRGLLILDEAGQAFGFCHYGLHPHTWGTGMLCHCEDLFVSESHRNLQAGTTLLQFLVKRGKSEDWDRIYGSTDTENTGARRLYERFVQEEDRKIFQIILRDYGWDG